MGGGSLHGQHLRDIGQVQGSRGREDVLEVLGARLLEAVQWRVAVVLGQALVLLALAGQLHVLVLGQGDAHRLPVQLVAVEVAHGCKGGRDPGDPRPEGAGQPASSSPGPAPYPAGPGSRPPSVPGHSPSC